MKNSKEWVDLLSNALFVAENRRIGGIITELTKQNNVQKKVDAIGFRHVGETFAIPGMKRASKTPLPTLSFVLTNQGNDLLKERRALELDKSLISQVLFKQLYQCNDLQEVRDSLPDCLIALIPELAKIPRKITDPLWINRNDERAMAQYRKILPKIEMYSVGQLLY